MDKAGKRLVGVTEVMKTYGLGRNTAVWVMSALPHVRIGLRLFVQQEDIEAFIQEAKSKGLNISGYAKQVLAEKRLKAGSNGGGVHQKENKG